jgi:Kdo2-lipid IVA lauroyltransferase/acyltransferase
MNKLLRMLEAGIVIVLSLPLAVLPMRWSLKAGEMLGLFVFYLWKSRKKIAIENLSKTIAAGQIKTRDPAEKIIRENFKNFGRSLIEVIKIYYGFGNPLIDSVVMEGVEYFQAAKSKNKGVIFVTGHCGNWELMALTTGLKFSHVSIVARPIDNPYLNKFIEGVRKKYGNSIIYKKGALKPIMQSLKKNHIVGILMDQAVLSNEGYVIDFLGRGAWTTKMPALLARKTGAAVLPAFIHRTDKGHRMVIYPEIELSRSEDTEKAVKEDTVKFSGFIEEYIKAHPAEWLWIHRRWKRVKEGFNYSE